MVKLCNLLGGASEAYYECMYTKHKTQKRKVWHDGFVALHASRRLVLYEEQPPDGKVLDEAKMTVYDWDRKDEEHIDIPKFLVEIINETPIQIEGSNGSSEPHGLAARLNGASSMESTSYQEHQRAPSNPSVPAKPAIRSKFKSPTIGNQGNNNVSAPYRPAHLSKKPMPGHRGPTPTNAPDPFDFARNPTSEWHYEPNAISRTPDEVAALWFGSDE
ncbi:hypothetical protein Poli38472_012283 [Pythium oligandrum]|uniref:5'-3' DNA helicase ZGRF1-like N-terminal domain-containing protein n=1 Tax=Pythium oligandrum TaxID=41045 RepID=A0A8K1CR57_PYTOL|nr:hypothetical protein Poli38472_012283 [Pythium oligandrum]|eukprot:TMW67167.1 hypothetical protein Poli38472_012283 [Pythium oligandrum]